MKHLKDFVKSEAGFITLEWSVLKCIFLVLIMVMLPDIVTIGNTIFYTQQVSSYAIQKVVENGQMTAQIADEVEKMLNKHGIKNFELYGTGDLTGYPDSVQVKIVAKVEPVILKIFPNIRFSNSIAKEDGVVTITASKVDISNVYVR